MQHETPTHVLTYAVPAKCSYRYVNAVAIATSVLLLGVFYFGFVPSGAMAFDYTRNIPFTEVIAGVLERSPDEVLADQFWHLVWFLSLGIAALTAFVLVRQQQLKGVISIAAMLLPMLLFPKIIVFVASLFPLLIFVPLIIPALLGQCDGETWSEGQVAYGVLLDWMILWLVLSVIVLRSRGRHISA